MKYENLSAKVVITVMHAFMIPPHTNYVERAGQIMKLFSTWNHSVWRGAFTMNDLSSQLLLFACQGVIICFTKSVFKNTPVLFSDVTAKVSFPAS